MKSNGLSFHHPIAFWSGCFFLVVGVLSHAPMFIHASHIGYRMAGMPMDAAMLIGMGLILVGLVLAAYGLTPRLAQLKRDGGAEQVHFHIADDAKLNRHHWTLVTVLIVALAVDVMKPATLGFVIPGLADEYEISKQSAGWLAFVALTGTTVGSVVWGRIADTLGRRAAILLSALMFIGTSICGAMPSFEWNLVMCFFMGASAGGLLPITFTLMAETVPTRHRGLLLVALGGVGTSAGYLLAAGAATMLEPLFSWRALWLLGLPTGALIIVLDRYIPESPRFLAGAGLGDQAREVMRRFSGFADSSSIAKAKESKDKAPPDSDAMATLMQGPHRSITWGLGICGIAWGLINFGFLLWLPANLRSMGMDGSVASGLLASSAIFAVLGIPVVTWLYHSWSSIRALVLFAAMTAASLTGFLLLDLWNIHSTAAIIAVTAFLLVTSSGVIAMLIPYAAEIYPVHLRATGTGVIAASTKIGGILGALCGVLGLFSDLSLSAIFVAVPMLISALILMKNGTDTRGLGLEAIQTELSSRNSVIVPLKR